MLEFSGGATTISNPLEFSRKRRELYSILIIALSLDTLVIVKLTGWIAGSILNFYYILLILKGRVIESYGPYGSHLQQNYCMQVKDGERIIEVRISHGYIVDAIGFVIYDSRVCSTRIAKSGGDSQEEAKVNMTIYCLWLVVIIKLAYFPLIKYNHSHQPTNAAQKQNLDGKR